MTKILFICHGNICRSPMAEYVFNYLAKKVGADCFAESKATSSEQLGCDIHYGTKAKLREKGIPFNFRRACRMESSDYYKYDLIIGMDRYNMQNMRRLFGSDPDNKLHKLLDYTDHPRDVDDPWYTGNFDDTYNDILEGCTALLNDIMRAEK